MTDGDEVLRQAREVAAAYARGHPSRAIVQDLVMRHQPPDEEWHFVSATPYAHPGSWLWVVLLYRELGMTGDGRMELRMKGELVIGEEAGTGKGGLTYLLKGPYEGDVV